MLRTRELNVRRHSMKQSHFFYTVGCALLLVFSACLFFEWADKSWGALQIALLFNPIANAIVAGCGIAGLLIIKRHQNFSVSSGLAMAIGMPVAATLINGVCMLSLGLHGC